MRNFPQHLRGDGFFRSLRINRIRTGRISQPDSLTAVLKPALRTRNSLSAPVARMLMQTGQCIEYRAFSDIRISGKQICFFMCQRADKNPVTV